MYMSRVDYPEHVTSPDKTCVVRNLPKLESLTLHNIDFPLHIYELPRLKIFSARSCNNHMQFLEENPFPIIEKIDYNGDRGTHFPVLHDGGIIKRFRELKECLIVLTHYPLNHEEHDYVDDLSNEDRCSSKIESLMLDNSHVLVKSVQNLPLLHSLGWKPTKDSVLHNLPSLKTLSVNGQSSDDHTEEVEDEQVENFKNLMRQIESIPSIESLSFGDGFRFFQCPFNASKLKNIKKLKVTQEGETYRHIPYERLKQKIFFDGEGMSMLEKFEGDIASDLTLKNHPNLESVVCESCQEYLHVSMQIKNCPKVNDVRITRWFKPEEQCPDEPEHQRKNELVLKNLWSLEKIRYCCNHHSLDVFRVVGCKSIKKMSIDLSDWKTGNEEETLEIDIDGSIYPNVEYIKVHDFDSIYKRKMVIGTISNLKKLRLIKVTGTRCLFDPFVKRINGVVLKDVKMNVPPEVWKLKKVTISTLYDYCQMRNCSVILH